ncbi:hypothetical protein FA15DRAFT_582172 [Coprinopsis marcescibilis]|uniref:SPIN90/Ldb17 leucine-rich domain-containing protein n=1 Tax=Coprinopsis marcescibilis TaxID=230819 RepID=A0A5C3LBX4_COPMA|nr:hypothetical protein FA15DRAFT_582172 [Coprinopsis marcescibilis]
MEDHLGIVYVIQTAQQFWSELEDILRVLNEDEPTLSLLDSTLRRFLTLCATYHEQYLQSPLQLEHAFGLLLDSELFQFHSERMCENIVEDALKTTDPHSLFIFFNTLYFHGCRRVEALRNQKRWHPLMPLLMDHILVEIDPDTEDTFFGGAGNRNSVFTGNVPVPIEVKLRSLGVKLLYEVCRVQKLSVQELRIFDDAFVDYLFDLVEQTRYMQDDAFNYSVIKLIVALNEQFMVAGLDTDGKKPAKPEEPRNRVIRILLRRASMSQTFGENMIFMLNRAKHTPEDFCMALLILKLLYILFTTRELAEYFYTNDLCVLVDVFLRELSNLDDGNESLRHTYLRVLHPLLTKTQLRTTPYKRPQIMALLESLISHASVRDVTVTTRRLVERCLSGDWCVQLKASQPPASLVNPPSSPQSEMFSPPGNFSTVSLATTHHLPNPTSKLRNMKFSKSVENLGARPESSRPPPIPRSPLDQVRHPNASTISLSSVPLSSSSSKTSPPAVPQRRSSSAYVSSDISSSGSGSSSSGSSAVGEARLLPHLRAPVRHQTLGYVPASSSLPRNIEDNVLGQPRLTRRPPPAPPKRRKPPAIPTIHNGVTMYPIKSSEPSPLSKSLKTPSGS